MKRMFSNVGATIEVIAKILFYLILAAGIITFIVGIVKVVILAAGFGEYHLSLPKILSLTAEDFATGKTKLVMGYTATSMVKRGVLIALSSLAVLPLYGFGTLVRTVCEIREELRPKQSE